ncbi:hypothetical protein Daus18300_002183 [Diaporthe australafricana]|uniref:25S rRNA (Uridine(2843)-N(3))-methyltransferase n=1 Tax=Diaporthe australafricana TaxID=127596 RepID=A0ABR3XRC9_9PEZI
MVKKPSPKSTPKPTPSKHAKPPKPKGSREPQPADQGPPTQDAAHQQKILGVFESSFSSVLSSQNFNKTLQEVKTALFNREFNKAFGNENFLEAYAARYSPTRALCYAAVLDRIRPHLNELSQYGSGGNTPVEGRGQDPLRTLAIGGGAAELVAMGSFLSHQPPGLTGSITLVDIGPWAGVVEKLRTGLSTAAPLSKYASAAAQAVNTPLVESTRLEDVTFKQQDVLCLSVDDLAAMMGAEEERRRPFLITLLFTLNELFTAGGIGKTTAFLLQLTKNVRPGSLLLGIDSPGSYSEITVGKESKRYPTKWLLDKILLDTAGDSWEKIQSQDSVWFRLSQELKYPIPLEDMRYQIHLYRATNRAQEN